MRCGCVTEGALHVTLKTLFLCRPPFGSNGPKYAPMAGGRPTITIRRRTDVMIVRKLLKNSLYLQTIDNILKCLVCRCGLVPNRHQFPQLWQLKYYINQTLAAYTRRTETDAFVNITTEFSVGRFHVFRDLGAASDGGPGQGPRSWRLFHSYMCNFCSRLF